MHIPGLRATPILRDGVQPSHQFQPPLALSPRKLFDICQSSAFALHGLNAEENVAQGAVAAGAEIINDVTAFNGDPKMLAFAAKSGAGVCAMHMRGTPRTMQDDPQYDDVVNEVLDYLRGVTSEAPARLGRPNSGLSVRLV